jgi:phosphatidate cytidylyltransferase
VPIKDRMSPRLALHDPTFRTFLLITAATLGLAGIVLALVGRTLGREIPSVWRTYRAWLVMAPLVLAVAFLGRGAVIVGCALLALLAFKEFARATGLYADRAMTGTVYALIAATALASLVSDPNRGTPGWFGLFEAMPAYGLCAILLVPIVRNRTKGQLQAAGLAVLGFAYVAWMFQHLGFLANARNAYGYVLFIVFATELCDVAAFTFGKSFGHKKLRPAISPGKTVAGALGALGVAMVLPWLLGFALPGFGTRQKLLTGLIVGVGGQLGDLTVSFIKRDLGVKDMGAAIPGHGGVLDRIDSLLYVAPLFLHLVNWYYGLP